MPLDPTIPLGVTPVQSNPLGALGNVMQFADTAQQIQQRQLANIAAQRALQGQQDFAQVVQSSIDPATGQPDYSKIIAGIGTHPSIAMSMPGAAAQLRQTQQFEYDIAQKKAAQVQDFTKQFYGVLGAGATQDPNFISDLQSGKLPQSVTNLINSIPTTATPQAAKITAQTLSALASDLPADPAAARAELSRRVRQYATLSGQSKEQFEQEFGQDYTHENPEGTYFGKRDPFTGLPTGIPSFLPKGFAPALTAAGNYQFPGSAPQGFLQGSGPTNALGGGAVPRALGQQAASPSAPVPPGAPVPPPPLPSYTSLLDGKPFSIPSDPAITAKSVAGQPVVNPKLEQTASEAEAARRAYDNASTTQQLVANIKNDLNTLGPSGFLAPGSLSDLRLDLAKFAQQAGVPVNVAKIAAAEDFMKDTQRLGLSYLTTALGVQREAAQTIAAIQKAVASYGNTPFGNRVLIAGIEALNDRQIDKHLYETQWAQQNGAVTTNTDAEFNRTHPPEAYVQNKLSALGLSPEGKFTSAHAILDALDKGWITDAQAKALKRSQFPQGGQ